MRKCHLLTKSTKSQTKKASEDECMCDMAEGSAEGKILIVLTSGFSLTWGNPWMAASPKGL